MWKEIINNGYPISSKRNMIHLELVRIVAVILVMFNHTNNKGFTYFSIAQDSMLYPIYLFVSIADKVAVPLFFMVSGALLLKKEEAVLTTYKKRVSRIIVVLVIVSFCYYMDDLSWEWSKIDFGSFLVDMYKGEILGRLWYLYSYLGFLIMLPVLRALVKGLETRHYLYLIVCHVVFVGFIPIIQFLIWRGDVQYSGKFEVGLITSKNIFFPLMGYFLEHVLEERYYTIRHILEINVLGIASISIACFATQFLINVSGNSSPQSFHNAMIAIPAIAVYMTIKSFMAKIECSEISKMTIQYIGSATFGIYLFERWFKACTKEVYAVFSPIVGSFLGAWLWCIAAFVIGFIIVTIARLIPGIRKYI